MFAGLSVALLIGMSGCTFVNKFELSHSHTLPEPSGIVPSGRVSDDKLALLNSLPYHGDRATSRMGSRMALAFADTLTSLPSTQTSADGKKKFRLGAALFDVTGDGFPILITCYSNDIAGGKVGTDFSPVIYSYQDGVVTPISFGEWGELWSLETCITGDRYGFCLRMPHGNKPGLPVGYQFYNVDKGKITRSYTVSEYIAVILNDNKTAFSMEMPSVASATKAKVRFSGATGEVSGYVATILALEQAGWERSGDTYLYYKINDTFWNPDTITTRTYSPLNDVLYSIDIQLPGGAGERVIYRKSPSSDWWLPIGDAEDAANILCEFALDENP